MMVHIVCTVIKCSLYIFEDHFFVFKEFLFQKILALCMVTVQEVVMMLHVWYLLQVALFCEYRSHASVTTVAIVS